MQQHQMAAFATPGLCLRRRKCGAVSQSLCTNSLQRAVALSGRCGRALIPRYLGVY